jgi:hypothetical protein
VHPTTTVRVEVAGPVVPAWQLRCIEALRALEGVAVAVHAGRSPYRAPRGPARWLLGPALAPVALPDAARAPVAPADTALAAAAASGAGAGVVVDLTGCAAVGDRETLRLRLGEDDDPRWPFAREIARGDAAVELALIRRAVGRETVVRGGRFRVTPSYGGTLRRALFAAAAWPALVVAARREGARFAETETGAPAPRGSLGAGARARFGASLAGRLAGHAVKTLFERAQWNVGFARAEPRALLAGEALAVDWLPDPPPGTFVADPFVVTREGRRVLFVEQYDESRGRGIIEALELGDNGAVIERRDALELATHLSYPYPVEIDGELYLVPENAAGGEAALYRCVAFPWRWEREAALLPNFDALDTTLFPHAGRWWAFCTRASHGSDFALHAFHAGGPRGPWRAHALNPIVEDVTRARPAGGPFVVDGALYRPGQDCSVSYGGGLTIARVDELSPEAYRETVVARVDTRRFGRYAGGVHTVGVTPAGLVFDGKRLTFDPFKPFAGVRIPLPRRRRR